ncbi:hypothetical protein EOL70_15750 [Leucothrix sargassi]|nr:hypothetical protein EOL70_15750 [Leucothrix sargassi]
MTSILSRVMSVLGLCLLLSACSQKETLFSEYPGFDQYLKQNQPSDALPTAEEQALLEQYRPRIFMEKGQTRFIDFYEDYIASGVLYVDSEQISNRVDQALLNQYKTDSKAEFRHTPLTRSGTPVVYGRVSYDMLTHQSQRYPLTFLSYNLAFANSGLIKGLAGWQRVAMGVVGDNDDWHQLDHYVGLTVALHEGQAIAVFLQQHNYRVTWLLDSSKEATESTLPLPDDKRIAVDVALQSNELYPHSPEIAEHPGVSFVTADNMTFFKTGKDKPMMAGWDITHGEEEQDYTLKFLAQSDAFYTFKGRLGEHRSLPGRDGPPGAQFNALPPLMPWASKLVTGFRAGSVDHEKAKASGLLSSDRSTVNEAVLDSYKADFIDALQAVKAETP